MRKVGCANSFAGSLHSKAQSDNRLVPFAEKFGVQPDIVHNIREPPRIERTQRLNGSVDCVSMLCNVYIAQN